MSIQLTMGDSSDGGEQLGQDPFSSSIEVVSDGNKRNRDELGSGSSLLGQPPKTARIDSSILGDTNINTKNNGDGYSDTKLPTPRSTPIISNNAQANKNNHFVIVSGFSSRYKNDRLVMKGFQEIRKKINIVNIKKLRDNKYGITLENERDVFKFMNTDFASTTIWKENPSLKLNLPATETEKRNLKSPLYPTIIKNVNMENEELNQILNDIGTDSKYVKDLENRKNQTVTGHKIAYLTNPAHRANLVTLGLTVDGLYYKCEIPNFIKKSIQCHKCLKFGHHKEQCQNAEKCIRCGKDHNVRNCSIKFGDVKCFNCHGKHPATYINCPTKLDYIHEYPPLSRRPRKQVRRETKPQTSTQTTPSIQNRYHVLETHNSPLWDDIMEQEQPLETIVPSLPVPSYAEITRPKQVGYENSTPKQVFMSPIQTEHQPNRSNSIKTKEAQIPVPPSERSQYHTPDIHYQTRLTNNMETPSMISRTKSVTKDTKVISLDELFVIIQHMMSFMIHRRGPVSMVDIGPFVHSLIKNLTGLETNQILDFGLYSPESEYY